MKALAVFILLPAITLGLFLIVRAGFIMFSKPTEEQRINRSVGAGLGAILFTMGILLFVGLFNNNRKTYTGPFYSTLQAICFGTFFMLMLGAIVAVGMHFHIKHGETLARGSQETKKRAKEIFEREYNKRK
jgi:hypothetical protein